MSLEDISRYKDTHAFLAPSQPAWLRYTESHLLDMYRQQSAQEKGTRLHAWAEESIKLGIWQKQRTNNMLYNYVNDAIVTQNSMLTTIFYVEPEIKSMVNDFKSMICNSTKTISDGYSYMTLARAAKSNSVYSMTN